MKTKQNKEIKELADTISHEIARAIEDEMKENKVNDSIGEEYINKRLTEHHLDPFIFKPRAGHEIVLVLGLNPSSTDIDNGLGRIDRWLLYVPEIDGKRDKHDPITIKEIDRTGLTYNNYFKKPYELFIDKGYQPIWTNKKYFDSIKDKLNLDKQKITFLNDYPDTKKYAIFSDLLFYKETTSRKIWGILNKNQNLVDTVFELFEVQIDLFKPKLVLINNAFGSKIIHNKITNPKQVCKNYSTSCVFKGARIVFSAIVSGGHVDVFAYERLKREVDKYI